MPCWNDMICTLVANYLIQSPPSNSSTTEVNSDISTDTSCSFNTEQSNESEKVTHKEVGNICLCTKYLRFDYMKCMITCSWHKKSKVRLYESTNPVFTNLKSAIKCFFGVKIRFYYNGLFCIFWLQSKFLPPRKT